METSFNAIDNRFEFQNVMDAPCQPRSQVDHCFKQAQRARDMPLKDGIKVEKVQSTSRQREDSSIKLLVSPTRNEVDNSEVPEQKTDLKQKLDLDLPLVSNFARQRFGVADFVRTTSS